MKVVITIDGKVCNSSLDEKIHLIKEIRDTIPGDGTNGCYDLLKTKQLVDLLSEKMDYLANNKVTLGVAGYEIGVTYLFTPCEIIRVGYALYKVVSDDGSKLFATSILDRGMNISLRIDRSDARLVSENWGDVYDAYIGFEQAIYRDERG